MNRRDLIVSGASLVGGLIAWPRSSSAQAWPTRDITIVVAVGPGSSADAVARGVGKVLAQKLGVPVQIKNVLGGAGLTGFAELAAAKPDGSFMGLVNVGGLLVFPHIMQVPYKWESFAFLGAVAENYYGIGIAAGSPIRTIDDLIAAGKSRVITYSASAIMNGIALVQLGNATGAKFRFVASQTQPEAVAQAVGGHVDLVVQTPPDMVAVLESKQMRLLASASTTAWPNYPESKSLMELGYKAATIVPLGFACPRGVPAELKAQLESAISAAASDAELISTMKKLTIQPQALSGADFEASLKGQAPIVEGILAAAGMKKT